jgi:6-phosphofructokinase 1
MQHGGTILSTTRSPEFKTEQGLRRALWQLERLGVEALVVIRGNGSQAGAHALSRMGMPVVGASSTMNNDLYGSDVTIGMDTVLP